MVVDESIEQDFIRILKSAQVDVSFDVFAFVLIGFVSTLGLHIDVIDVSGKEPDEAELFALFPAERVALVEQRALEERLARELDFDRFHVSVCHIDSLILESIRE
jgi:hypothetical protein